MLEQKLLLTLTPNADVEAVRQDCEKLGLEHIQVLPNAGIIIGTGDPSIANALLGVCGVSAVELEKQISVAPPDSDIQ